MRCDREEITRSGRKHRVIGPERLHQDDVSTSGAPVGVAASAIQDVTEVLTKGLDGRPVLRIRVAIPNPDDHGPDRPGILARWGKHRRREPFALLIAKGQEHGHDALEVRHGPAENASRRRGS